MGRSTPAARVPATGIDWADLNKRTESYSFVQCAADEDDAIFCGLHLRMSEIGEKMSLAAEESLDPFPFLFIFADTLLLDDFALPSSSTTIVARCLQLAKDDPLVAGGDGGTSQVLILTSEVTGGQFRIQGPDTEAWCPDLNDPALKMPKAVTFVQARKLRREVSSGSNIVLDRLRHPIAWNSFKAEFAAAVILLERNNSKAAAAALAMLRWIHECTGLVGKKRGPFQMEANDLNYQSASLLVQAGARRGAAYVPVLSKDFYEERVRRLLGVVESHEKKLGELDALSAIDGVTHKFSAALKEISAANVEAIDATFDNAMEELQSLREEYNRLLYELSLQEMEVQTAELLFKNALEVKKFWDKVQALIAVASAVISVAGGVSALASIDDVAESTLLLQEIADQLGVGIADKVAVAGKVSERLTTLTSRIQAAVSSGFGTLAKAAGSLQERLSAIEAMVEVAFKFQELYDASDRAITELKGDAGPEIELPEWADIGSMDPDMEWNMYMAEMEAQIDPYADVEGSGAYKSSLVAYTEYAKALNRKTIAMAHVQARSLEILAQKKAAETAVERWEQMEGEAKNEEQKKAALRALLEQQLTNAKRSLLVAARVYRAAYLYRWLSEPGMKVDLEMTHQQLAVEFANITRSVEELLSTGRPAQTFVTDAMRIPVLRSGPRTSQAASESIPEGIYAVLKKVGGKALLTWSIPISAPPFKGALPPNDRLAVFIEEGWFHLEGAKPNSQGSIIVKVTTSGEYVNGYGKAGGSAPRSFASKPLEMDFIYGFTQDGGIKEPPNTPWMPAEEIRASYMRPSPFTQFTLTVESAGSLKDLSALILKFRGVYHKVRTK